MDLDADVDEGAFVALLKADLVREEDEEDEKEEDKKIFKRKSADRENAACRLSPIFTMATFR